MEEQGDLSDEEYRQLETEIYKHEEEEDNEKRSDWEEY